MGTFLLWLIGAASALAVGLAAGWLTAAPKRDKRSDWWPSRRKLHRQLMELTVKVEKFEDGNETPQMADVAEWVRDLRSMAGTLGDDKAPQPSGKPAIATTEFEPTTVADDAAAEPEPTPEKRGADRRPFDSEQLIAQYNGRRIPKAWSFRLYKCRDVSTRGLSFYSDQRMANEQVIVRLGNATQAKFIVASIVRTTRTRRSDGDTYCVACKFIEILDHHRVPDALRIQLNAYLEREHDLVNAPLCKTVSIR
jgi:hypothetical protein